MSKGYSKYGGFFGGFSITTCEIFMYVEWSSGTIIVYRMFWKWHRRSKIRETDTISTISKKQVFLSPDFMMPEVRTRAGKKIPRRSGGFGRDSKPLCRNYYESILGSSLSSNSFAISYFIMSRIVSISNTCRHCTSKSTFIICILTCFARIFKGSPENVS